ncbi:MAG: hypothetical protein KAX49_07190 [Halanaerobiales bacterium]|nr:hypothetical protein [Halanaerobiales bacterium]
MADKYDGITIGTLATEKYLEETGIMANSVSISKLYIAKYRSDLAYNDTGVLNVSDDDSNSNVYELVKPAVFETDANNDLEVIVKNPVETDEGVDELLVVLKGRVCADNTTDTPLAVDEVFTGDWQDTLNYGVISVGVKADQDSATDGLCICWSADGITIDDMDVFSILANVGKTFTFGPARRYVKIIYTNGGVEQTTFNLQTMLKKTYVKPSSHRINDHIVAEDDAELIKSVITGENPAGTFVNFKSTTAGNFKISLEELENDVSVNSNTQLKTTVYDEAGNPLEIDDTSGAMEIVEYEHHEIHEGNHFFICDYDDTLGIGDTIEFVITTPNTLKWAHMLFDFSSILGAELEVYEGSSDVVGGTSTTPTNNNRNSGTTSDLTLLKDPTSITDGTRIAGYLAGANRTAGFNSRNREIILKQDTIYLFRFTSDANLNAITFCGEWYEHINK